MDLPAIETSEEPTPYDILYANLDAQEKREEWLDLMSPIREYPSVEIRIAQALFDGGLLKKKCYLALYEIQREIDLPNKFWADVQSFLQEFTYKKKPTEKKAAKKKATKRKSSTERAASVTAESKTESFGSGSEDERPPWEEPVERPSESPPPLQLSPREQAKADKYRAAYVGGPEQPLWGRVLYQAINYGEITWEILAAKCGASVERVQHMIDYKYDAEWVASVDTGREPTDRVLVKFVMMP